MDRPLVSAEVPTNGAAASTPSPCPFNDLPENLHQYIHATETRIAKLESDRDRFEQALLNVGKFIFDSPMSKMMLAALPKEAQEKLRSYFGK
jgi:hypothetical protein